MSSESLLRFAVKGNSMKKTLTQAELIQAAKQFCVRNHTYANLFGVTDGKAVGTFIEHEFQDYLESQYVGEIGNSASGLDLPMLNTDIKVTSIRQPQSSCPFRSARQKVYGLGYNLLLFVYDKQDNHRTKKAKLTFVSCAYIESERTADYRTTRDLLKLLADDGNREEVFALMADWNLPAEEPMLRALSDEIMQTPPTQGYLTISNALQWRLQYGRIVGLSEPVSGIIKIV